MAFIEIYIIIIQVASMVIIFAHIYTQNVYSS